MPTDSIRAALERLISAYDEHGGRWPQHDEDALHDAVERARADLAAEPPDPAAGGEALLAPAPAPKEDVGELVAWLLQRCQLMSEAPGSEFHLFTRAAALLQQQAAELAALRAGVVPVAVSDRPWEREAGWRDLHGECWWCPPEGPPYWSMVDPTMVYGGSVLPSHTIPLPAPQGREVE